MKEKDIERYFCNLVKENGGIVRKLQWVGHNGAPDRLVAMPGGGLFLAEIKKPGGSPDPHQDREIQRFAKLGTEVLVIDSYQAAYRFIDIWNRV